jgi:hypothetical protein
VADRHENRPNEESEAPQDSDATAAEPVERAAAAAAALAEREQSDRLRRTLRRKYH